MLYLGNVPDLFILFPVNHINLNIINKQIFLKDRKFSWDFESLIGFYNKVRERVNFPVLLQLLLPLLCVDVTVVCTVVCLIYSQARIGLIWCFHNYSLNKYHQLTKSPTTSMTYFFERILLKAFYNTQSNSKACPINNPLDKLT